MSPAKTRRKDVFPPAELLDLLDSLDQSITQQELLVDSVFQEEKTLHHILGALRSKFLRPKQWREFVLDSLGAVPDCHVLLHRAADKVSQSSSQKEMRRYLEKEFREVRERSFQARLILYRLKEEYALQKRSLEEG